MQVTWKTLDGPMHHSGMSHRAMSQLTRWLSLDFKNRIIIYTHIGDNWMIEVRRQRLETYSELPTQRFQHQYFDDINLIKNMVFDLDVPTIGALPGPGFHWDSAMLCDLTMCSEDTKMEVPHAQGAGARRRYGPDVPALLRHQAGQLLHDDLPPVHRRQMLEWGMVNESCPRARCWSGLGDRPHVEDHALREPHHHVQPGQAAAEEAAGGGFEAAHRL